MGGVGGRAFELKDNNNPAKYIAIQYIELK